MKKMNEREKGFDLLLCKSTRRLSSVPADIWRSCTSSKPLLLYSWKFVNDLHGLISPVPQGTPLPLVLLGKSKNALLSTFLFLDQIVWLGRSGIYKNKERAELIGRISLFCWMGSSVCSTLVEFVNDLHGLISPVPQGTPLPLVLLGKSKNALLSTFLFLDQIVWLGRSGIYKNKERAELIGRISLFCWMGSSVCSTLVELGELGRLSTSMKKLEKDLTNNDKYKNEEYCAKLQKSNGRTLALVKAGMDIVLAVGLLQSAPKKVTPRVTGAFGFVSSLISCYQVLDSRHSILYLMSPFLFTGLYFHHHPSPRHTEVGKPVLQNKLEYDMNNLIELVPKAHIVSFEEFVNLG
ncbi:Peroxisomal biogenesis factor 11 - like 1 [Theobroma cacao]|nr:Peroxisomal biogenesis factor 11 - like 1 [Theobroma cacao]